MIFFRKPASTFRDHALREESENGKDSCNHEGERRRGRRPGRTAHIAGAFHPRKSATHRHPYRLRDHALRRLHRRSRRYVGEELYGFRGAGPRVRRHHDRRHGQRRRHVVGAAGRIPDDARAAMRLLHARHDFARAKAAQGKSLAVRGGNPDGYLRQYLPLHRLSEHRQGDPVRRRQDQWRRIAGGCGMNDMTPTREQREAKLEGMGCKGNYVDDLKLPGMLHGDFVRSPHAHARVKSINDAEALKVPGVLAVITAETLKTVNLAWMPTLAGDVQMVLADGKVLFQNQEVAFVIAEERYVAADAADLVEVEYEALPVNVDPLKAMAQDAPVIREDIKDKTEGAHGKRKHYNHVFNWQAGDKAATDLAFANAEVTIKEFIVYPRVHPCPLETCQCVASFDKIKGELTLWGTFQAPHVIRTVASLISKIPEHTIHVISPDIGGGFGNKVGAYPGYICAIVASIVTGRPVKWVEDRIENLSTTAFARDYHMMTEIAATKDGKVTGLRVYTIADHGAFDACADPTKWPAGFFNIVTGSYDFPVAHVTVDGVYSNKAPGGVAYRCSFRVTEAAYCIERGMDILAQKLGM